MFTKPLAKPATTQPQPGNTSDTTPSPHPAIGFAKAVNTDRLEQLARSVEHLPFAQLIAEARQRQGLSLNGVARGMHAAARNEGTHCATTRQAILGYERGRIPHPDIAGGLNTSVQVQQKSLDELAGKFEWIKDELRTESYFDRIAWQENQGGPDKFDVLYLLSLLTCFNVHAYPNSQDRQPVAAYEKKTDVLRPIVKDIIRLHDTIDQDAQSIWNEKDGGGKYGNFSFVAKKGKGKHFLPVEVEFPMLAGALFPILGALRWTVVANPDTGEAHWEYGFDKVIELWRELAVELLTATAQVNSDLGRNPHALGRSRNHWSSLHTKVGLRYLQKKNAAERAAN